MGVYGTLDQSQNHIHYPNSKFDNIRNNMGKGSGSSATSTSSHKTTTTTHKSTTTTRKTTTTSHSATPTSSGQCSGVAAWNADTEYKPNAKVTYSKCLIVWSCFGRTYRVVRWPPLDCERLLAQRYPRELWYVFVRSIPSCRC